MVIVVFVVDFFFFWGGNRLLWVFTVGGIGVVGFFVQRARPREEVVSGVC